MADMLPPLQTLRAFEATGRRLSMTLAADELHLTHGAVSRQIKALEDHLGVPMPPVSAMSRSRSFGTGSCASTRAVPKA